MYKDRDKQREANRKAQAKFKAKHTADIKKMEEEYETKGITEQGITSGGITKVERVADLGGKEHSMDCDPKILAEFRASKPERTAQGNIRVSKPGDADYNGICTPEWRAERGR